MSNLTFKTNHQIEFLQLIFRKLNNDLMFTGSVHEYDQAIWLELTISLSDTQIFSFLPRLVRMVWQHEECLHILEERNAKTPAPFEINKMTALIVSKRRSVKMDFEQKALHKRVIFLEQQFETLSVQVFNLMEELEVVKDELKQQKNKSSSFLLSTNRLIPIIKDPELLEQPLATLTSISQKIIPY